MYNRPNQIKDYIIDYNQIVNEGKEVKTFKCENIQIIEINQLKQEKENLELIKQNEHSNVLKLYDLVEKNENIYIFLETYKGDLNSIYIFNVQRFSTLNHSRIFASKKIEYYCWRYDYRNNFIQNNQWYSNNQMKNETTDLANTIDEIPLYKAPETQKINEKLTDTCDIYSLGIIFYRLYFQGNFPEQIQDQKQQKEFYKKLKNKSWKCPINQYTTNEFIKLIENMIVYEPKNRCSWEQLDSSPELQQKFIIWKDKYLIDLIAVCGSGAQGLILQTSDLQNNKTVLAKKVDIQNQPGQREKQIYQSLIGHKNENVIKVLDICQLYKSQFCYLILEKGELNLNKYFEQKQTFNKEEIIDFIEQIVNGYCFLKNKNIIHRDLKPDNIVIVFDSNKKPIYKLIDFGAGKILTQSNMPWTQAGTPLFQAPEVYRGGSEYDHTCDIFSFGIILFYMVFKQYPSNASKEQELRKWHDQIKQNPFRCPNYQEPEICQLIEIMLLYDRTKRITWEQLQIHSSILPNAKQNQRESVAGNNQQIQQQQQIIVFPEIQQLHQQQEYSQQQSQNFQSQQSQNLNIFIENYEHNNEIYDNQQFALNSSELRISKNDFQNQNSYNQRSIQQIQNAPLNNQNIITQENEVSSEYIYKIMLLTRRFVNEADRFLDNHQQFQYMFQLIFQIQFALRFQISCIQTLDQIFQNKTIKIKGVSFKNDRTETLKQQINQCKFETEIQEKDEKYSAKIDQISSDLKVKMKYITLKNEMDEKIIKKVTHLDIDVAHHYFCVFYQTFREGINQNHETSLLLKYLLEKMNNIFNDYPVDKPQQYQLKDIYCPVIQVPVQEKYLKRQQF